MTTSGRGGRLGNDRRHAARLLLAPVRLWCSPSRCWPPARPSQDPAVSRERAPRLPTDALEQVTLPRRARSRPAPTTRRFPSTTCGSAPARWLVVLLIVALGPRSCSSHGVLRAARDRGVPAQRPQGKALLREQTDTSTRRLTAGGSVRLVAARCHRASAASSQSVPLLRDLTFGHAGPGQVLR